MAERGAEEMSCDSMKAQQTLAAGLSVTSPPRASPSATGGGSGTQAAQVENILIQAKLTLQVLILVMWFMCFSSFFMFSFFCDWSLALFL